MYMQRCYLEDKGQRCPSAEALSEQSRKVLPTVMDAVLERQMVQVGRPRQHQELSEILKTVFCKRRLKNTGVLPSGRREKFIL